MVLLSFSQIPWWALSGFAFIGGVALGWALWSKYKVAGGQLEQQIKDMQSRIDMLEGQLATDKTKFADMEGEIAIAKGKLREAAAETMIWREKASKT
ncbi:MAG: hypothetical protein IPN29_08410 [Saprospiraceae bacterium]|nr:hypothetical protein [Saprospiraceae bacterium]